MAGGQASEDSAGGAEQACRGLRSARREQSSQRRLNAIFEEEDAMEAARLGEAPLKDGFRCRFCQSWFPEAYRLAAHERECGTVGEPKREENAMPMAAHKPLPCRYCEAVFPTLKDLSAHQWAAHREAVLARRREGREQRQRDEQTIDAASDGGNGRGAKGARASVAGDVASADDSPKPERAAGREAPRALRAGAPICPTCGAAVPHETAALVAALQAEGLAELQAFAAARVARRFLGAGR